jgi:hypothetical protein
MWSFLSNQFWGCWFVGVGDDNQQPFITALDRTGANGALD